MLCANWLCAKWGKVDQDLLFKADLVGCLDMLSYISPTVHRRIIKVPTVCVRDEFTALSALIHSQQQ